MIPNKNILLLLILVLASCKSMKNYNESVTKIHTKEELIEDVDFMIKKLERYHPRLYDYISQEEFYAKAESLKSDLKPMTSQEFLTTLYPLVSEIKQGHLALKPAFTKRSKKEKKRYYSATNELKNIDFTWINNGIYVENTFGETDSLLIGSKLTKIDSLDADLFLNTWKEKITSDGYNTTFQPQLLADRILRYYSFEVGRTDSIHLEFSKGDSLFQHTLMIKFKDQIRDTLSKTSPKKEPEKLSKSDKKKKKKERKKQYENNRKIGYSSKTKLSTRDFRRFGKDSSIAYLRIRGFKGWNKWSKKFYEETFASIDSLGTEYLILDLRDNTGGSLKEIGNLYGFFAKEEFTFINPMETKTRLISTSRMWSGGSTFAGACIKGLATPFSVTSDLIKSKKVNQKLYRKNKFNKTREPFENAFKGKLYVLINGLSFSASSILSTNLHGSGRATFIGEETGGAYNGTVAGIYQKKPLPNSKLILPLWMMNIDAPYKTEPNGYGIQPDVKVQPKLDDLIEGRDTILDWTINTIESNK